MLTSRWLLALALGCAIGAASARDLDAQAMRADIEQFRREFLDRDRAYADHARSEAEARLALLQARAGEIDAIAFGLELSRIAALADNGHTLSFAAPRLARSNRVEIRLAPFGDQFHVLRAKAADADLLGARLVAIDDVPLTRLREAAHTLTGGTAAWRDRQAPFLFESPQQLHALGLIPHRDAARYGFVLADGRPIERRLPAQPPSGDRARAETHRLLLPEVTPPEHGWQGVLTLDRAPWALRDALNRFRWRAIDELDTLVVQMRQTFDSQNLKLEDFYAQVRASLRERPRRHLVLDLRQNGGGDLTRARDFVESLPTLVPGSLFVLTSPWTFSAAIAITGYLKQAAPERVRIVGEPVGDRLEFFAEGRSITLKHSGEVLLPATERHDYRGGCKAYRDCHGHVVRRPIAVATLAPDLPAAWTFEAYRAGVDPAMEAVAQALKSAAR